MMMHQKPTVDVPPWSSLLEDSAAYSPPVSGVSGAMLSDAALTALALQQRYAASTDLYDDEHGDGEEYGDFGDAALDAYSCDEFRMYEFKIRRCARGRSHDWTECPYAHPGEKARRRDPRKYHYSGTACPDFRKGSCKRGESCDMAHGVFECWLHPARYRTQPCKDGTACRRRVCFFAHTPDQLRVLPQSPKTPLESYDGSPLRHHQQQQQQQIVFSQAAGAGLSPPMSPTGEGGSSPMSPEFRRASWPMNEVLASLRKLQLGKVSPVAVRGLGVGFGSPRSGGGGVGGAASALFRGGFCSLPSTPTRAIGGLDFGGEDDTEHVERVESGRALRARMYERLIKEKQQQQQPDVAAAGPDVDWVSELVK